jgi:hypothetical protein
MHASTCFFIVQRRDSALWEFPCGPVDGGCSGSVPSREVDAGVLRRYWKETLGFDVTVGERILDQDFETDDPWGAGILVTVAAYFVEMPSEAFESNPRLYSGLTPYSGWTFVGSSAEGVDPDPFSRGVVPSFLPILDAARCALVRRNHAAAGVPVCDGKSIDCPVCFPVRAEIDIETAARLEKAVETQEPEEEVQILGGTLHSASLPLGEDVASLLGRGERPLKPGDWGQGVSRWKLRLPEVMEHDSRSLAPLFEQNKVVHPVAFRLIRTEDGDLDFRFDYTIPPEPRTETQPDDPASIRQRNVHIETCPACRANFEAWGARVRDPTLQVSLADLFSAPPFCTEGRLLDDLVSKEDRMSFLLHETTLEALARAAFRVTGWPFSPSLVRDVVQRMMTTTTAPSETPIPIIPPPTLPEEVEPEASEHRAADLAARLEDGNVEGVARRCYEVIARTALPLTFGWTWTTAPRHLREAARDLARLLVTIWKQR